MDQEHQKLVGICGLYCGDCPHYLADRLGDQEQLAALSQKSGLPIEEVSCDGCLSDRVFRDCQECKHGFRACSAQHVVTWCFQCEEFPCQRLRAFSTEHVVNGIYHHRRVIEDLEYLRDKGTKDWVTSQENRSDCPECGRPGYWFTTACPACGTKIR
ncbi:MAG: DUF3795 domain-containing protein [Deltaproteobacteria bacterium]|nr:DUF3795 domain-containing protein [Deltaproteobacteria bacterium]